MPDHLTPEQRSRAMTRTGLEKLVQHELRARGLRFKQVRGLPVSPDIVFPEWRLDFCSDA